MAWYDGASWTGTQWTDKSGTGKHATTVSGYFVTSTLNGLPVLTGTKTSKIRFPVGILPPTYTLFHVAKYNGVSRNAIFMSPDNTFARWYSGFNSGASGVADHNGYITTTSNRHGTNWVVSTDQNAIYRSQGVDRTTTGPGIPSYAQMTINWFEPDYYSSDWAVAEILVYDRKLSLQEIHDAEGYLFKRYGLSPTA